MINSNSTRPAPTNGDRRANKNYSNKNNGVMMNEAIRVPKMIVISEVGENLGEKTKAEALSLANARNLDLVVISQNNGSIIAKIMDYGKYKFAQQQKAKSNKKNQSISKVKEIKVKPTIGDHDLNVRANNAKKWLADGDKVKFIIEARGRMCTKSEIIKETYDKFVTLLEGKGTITTSFKQVNNFRYETMIEPNKK